MRTRRWQNCLSRLWPGVKFIGVSVPRIATTGNGFFTWGWRGCVPSFHLLYNMFSIDTVLLKIMIAGKWSCGNHESDDPSGGLVTCTLSNSCIHGSWRQTRDKSHNPTSFWIIDLPWNRVQVVVTYELYWFLYILFSSPFLLFRRFGSYPNFSYPLFALVIVSTADIMCTKSLGSDSRWLPFLIRVSDTLLLSNRSTSAMDRSQGTSSSSWPWSRCTGHDIGMLVLSNRSHRVPSSISCFVMGYGLSEYAEDWWMIPSV